VSKLVLSVKREERNVGVLCMLGGYKSLGRGLARLNRLRVVVGAVRALIYSGFVCGNGAWD